MRGGSIYNQQLSSEDKLIEDAIKLAWTAVAYWPPKDMEIYQVSYSECLNARIIGRYGEEVTVTLNRDYLVKDAMELARSYYTQVREQYVKALNLPYLEAKIRLRAIPEMMEVV
jgi:hypothetical protein